VISGKTKLALWMCGSALSIGLHFHHMTSGGVDKGMEATLILMIIIMGGGLFYTASVLPKGTFGPKTI